MATRTGIFNDNTKTAKVVTIQVTAYDAATTYTINVQDESGTSETSVSTSGGGTVNAVASQLRDAWAASTHPLCTVVTASVSTDTVTLTAKTAGVPFYVSSAVAGGTGTIGAATTATANRGPNDWNDPYNWLEGEAPVATDDVFIVSGADIQYGLNQSGVALGDFSVESSATGKIGRRGFFLRIDPNYFSFAGSGEAWIDTGTTTDIRHDILRTGPSPGPGQYALNLKHVDTLNASDLYFLSGSIQLIESEYDTLYVGRHPDISLPLDVLIIDEASSNEIFVYNGNVVIRLTTGSDNTALRMFGGILIDQRNSGTMATVRLYSGTWAKQGGIGCTTLSIYDSGHADLSQNRGGTITTTQVWPGFKLSDNGIGTFTNKPAMQVPMVLSGSELT